MPLIPFINSEEIQARIPLLAQEITHTISTEAPVTVLILLNGALWFSADLLRYLPLNFHASTMKVSSYGMSKTSSGKVLWDQKWPSYQDQTVLILDDVLDSGLTLASVKEKLLSLGAKEVYTAVAIDKQVQRTVPFKADFVAFTARNEFLVGYGMDFAEHYRNLPYIAVLKE